MHHHYCVYTDPFRFEIGLGLESVVYTGPKWTAVGPANWAWSAQLWASVSILLHTMLPVFKLPDERRLDMQGTEWGRLSYEHFSSVLLTNKDGWQLEWWRGPLSNQRWADEELQALLEKETRDKKRWSSTQHYMEKTTLAYIVKRDSEHIFVNPYIWQYLAVFHSIGQL